uniref:Uncharacterized protein n=1 Tax=Aegilops tauschii subsp. strangulata TaxID=200361 RepID=A0A452XZ61_AEGTS
KEATSRTTHKKLCSKYQFICEARPDQPASFPLCASSKMHVSSWSINRDLDLFDPPMLGTATKTHESVLACVHGEDEVAECRSWPTHRPRTHALARRSGRGPTSAAR